ncbi:MAG: hypothetical protein DSZ23_00330 [Thermodesulfatator sp.]|nr:MAG: hypothetical protein DSZ23_00330 [Thermodesulfatator sp.]
MRKAQLLSRLSIKYKIIVPVVAMLLLSSAVSAVIVYRSIKKADEKAIMGELRVVETVLQQRIKEAETAAGMLTENLAHNNDVQFSIALKDKGLLKTNSAPFIKNLEDGSFLQGYFDFLDSQGEVIYSSLNNKMAGLNLASARPLVKKLLSEKKPVSGLEAGPDGVFVRAISPVIYNGEFAGAVEFNVSLKSVFEKATGHSRNIAIGLLLPKKTFAGGSEPVIEKLGKTLAYYTDARPFSSLPNLEQPEAGTQFLQKNNILYRTFPLKIGRSGVSAMGIMAYDSTKRSDAVLGAMKKLAIALGTSAILIAVVMSLFLSRIIAPINYIVTGMKDLSRGNFSSLIPEVSRDELGQLARLGNNILYSFGRLISTLRDDAKNLTTAAGHIRSSGIQFEQGISSLDRESDILASKAASVSESLQQTSQSMEDLSTASSEIASSVATSAASASEVLDMSVRANDVIHNLGKSSEKIGEIVKVINNVAEQTNLLALNATIEAARAGEAGKGFAVVAGEVKELARQTSRATEEIARMINAIQADTRQAVNVVEEIGEKISTVTDMTNTVASATEEQTATISEISNTIESGMMDVQNLAQLAKMLKDETLKFSESVASATSSQEAIVELADELQIVARYFDVSDRAIQEAAEKADDKVRLMSATLKHFRWKQRLTLAILEGTAVDIEHNPEECDLGRFVRERLEQATEQEGSIMREIADKHSRLHELGHEVMKNLETGNRDSARRIFKEELGPLFHDMLELLERAKGLTMGRKAA